MCLYPLGYVAVNASVCHENAVEEFIVPKWQAAAVKGNELGWAIAAI